MLKKIIPAFFFSVKLKHPLPHFLGHPSFVNTMERSSLYQLIALNKVFLLPEIHNINFSIILKFRSPSFLLNMNLPFLQSSCFYNNFFLSQANLEIELKNFFALIFYRLEHDIWPWSASSGSWRCHWGWRWSKRDVCVL